MNAAEAKQAFRDILTGVTETIVEAGAEGIPSTVVQAALEPIPAHTYRMLERALIVSGKIQKRDNCLFGKDIS